MEKMTLTQLIAYPCTFCGITYLVGNIHICIVEKTCNLLFHGPLAE